MWTCEYKRILVLFDTQPSPVVKEVAELLTTVNGAIGVWLRRSEHATLLAEAQAEGVSLNRLHLWELVVQLRAVM